MNLRDEILKEHSKRQAHKIAAWVGSDEDRFEELLEFVLKDEPIVSQRAAYAFGVVADLQPQLMQKHLEVLIETLKQPKLHDAVKRNIVRMLQEVHIPDDLLGTVTDVCFGYLASGVEPIAIKAFSMTVLLKVARRYPDIKNELKMLIEHQLIDASPATLNRGQKVLKELEKLGD